MFDFGPYEHFLLGQEVRPLVTIHPRGYDHLLVGDADPMVVLPLVCVPSQKRLEHLLDPALVPGVDAGQLAIQRLGHPLGLVL